MSRQFKTKEAANRFIAKLEEKHGIYVQILATYKEEDSYVVRYDICL